MSKLMKSAGIFFLIVLPMAVATFESCKKQTGPEGPQGPAGPSGQNGVTNMSTFTFTTTSGNWIADTPNKTYYYNFPCSAITNAIVSNGDVHVYLGDGSGSGWVALPASKSGIEINYAYSAGSVEIDFSLASGAMPANPGGQQFKVVVIPQ